CGLSESGRWLLPNAAARSAVMYPFPITKPPGPVAGTYTSPSGQAGTHAPFVSSQRSIELHGAAHAFGAAGSALAEGAADGEVDAGALVDAATGGAEGGGGAASGRSGAGFEQAASDSASRGAS